MTVNVCPAIVIVPVRPVPVALRAAAYVTVPLPAPLAPDVMVNQEALLCAVHGQDAPVAVNAMEAEPPTWKKLLPFAPGVTAHDGGGGGGGEPTGPPPVDPVVTI